MKTHGPQKLLAYIYPENLDVLALKVMKTFLKAYFHFLFSRDYRKDLTRSPLELKDLFD